MRRQKFGASPGALLTFLPTYSQHKSLIYIEYMISTILQKIRTFIGHSLFKFNWKKVVKRQVEKLNAHNYSFF